MVYNMQVDSAWLALSLSEQSKVLARDLNGTRWSIELVPLIFHCGHYIYISGNDTQRRRTRKRRYAQQYFTLP